MADDVTIDNGTGTDFDVATDDDGSGNHVQIVKLARSADGSRVAISADADGMLVNLGANNDVAVTSISAGTNNIGDVDVLTVVPGTGATNLGKAIDTAAGSTDTGVAVLAVRDDALSALTPAETDYVPLRTDSTGALWVNPASSVTVGDGGGSLSIDDGGGTITIDDGGLTIGIDDNGGSITVDVGAAIPAGTNAIGKLAANSGVDIGDVDVTSLVPGTTATSLGKAIDAVAGATDTGVAVVAIRDDVTSTLTPAEGDYAPLRVDSRGRLHVNVDGVSIPGTPVAATLNRVNNSAADVIAAGASGVITYVTHILVTCAHATVGTKVSIRDGTTVKYTGFAKADGGGFSASLPTPLVGTAATAWTAICGTSGSDVDISISGYQV